MLMTTQEGKLDNSFDWEFEFFLIITFKGFRTYLKIDEVRVDTACQAIQRGPKSKPEPKSESEWSKEGSGRESQRGRGSSKKEKLEANLSGILSGSLWVALWL